MVNTIEKGWRKERECNPFEEEIKQVMD